MSVLDTTVYLCSRNTAKSIHHSATILRAPYSPFACGGQYQRFVQMESSTLGSQLEANGFTSRLPWVHNWKPMGSRVVYLGFITGSQRVHESSTLGSQLESHGFTRSLPWVHNWKPTGSRVVYLGFTTGSTYFLKICLMIKQRTHKLEAKGLKRVSLPLVNILESDAIRRKPHP